LGYGEGEVVMARLFTIKDAASLRSVMLAVWDAVKELIHGGSLDITVARASKTRLQESRYHAMIGDISKQVDFDGIEYDTTTWKAQLIDQFQQEKLLLGEQLAKPGRTVMSLDKQRIVQIRPSSTDFRKKEASDFIEYLFSFGAEMSVEWTDPETQAQYKEYWEREINGR
jgi:hypothetical protein